MAGFSELIKNFSKTRDYLRDFFIYGFKVRGDFSRKSSRTYDDEKRRAESWLGDNIHYDSSVRGKQISISVDSGHISENPLYNAYWSKSFTDNDIRLHFLLCDIMADGASYSLGTLCTELVDRYGAVFDEQTVRNKLKEYAEEGIVCTERIGRSSFFRLTPDTAESFFEEYKGLDDAVRFFSEAPEFGVVGSSILRFAGLENDSFLIKHNYIVHALEDSILPEMITAAERKRYIVISVNSAKGTAGAAEENSLHVVPMKILVSLQTGRRYLAAYSPQHRSFRSYRLDFIRRAEEAGECPEYDELMADFERCCKNCFGVSFGDRKENGNVQPLRLSFIVDEKNEPYIIDRLNREKRCGILERTGEGLYTLTLDVFDPNEVMHWAKTFIGRIVSVEGGSESIRRRFDKDMHRMYKMYCGGKESADESVQ